MKETAKRLLSMALVLVMVLSLLPATALAAGGTETESGSSKPSVADAFGFKTDPPAGYDANDGIHPFSQSGTNDTINMVPVKEVGLLTTSQSYSTFSSNINVYNFDSEKDNLADFSDETKLFSTQTYSYNASDKAGDETFRLASGVAYDPTGSGRDNHVFYYGADASIHSNYSKGDWNYLSMKDFSYEGGAQGAVASGRLDPNEGNSEKDRAYDWALDEEVVDEAPDKYLSVIAGNFNGNGKETVVVYDPQFGNFTLRECTVNGESIETSLVFDVGNEVTVYGLNTHVTYTLNEAVTTIRSQYASIFPKFMPLVHLTAGDLDGDEKDELVVTVTPLSYESGSAYMVESASRIFILNKENDGEGNAVWTVKASKVFNDEGASVNGAAAVIGDFNNDNKNELVLVSDLKLIMMQYSSGQLTSLGETIIAYFSDNGVMPKDSDTSPIYSVPSVGAVRLDGTGTSPYLFISDKFWRYDNEGGTFHKAYEVSTSITYSGNPIRRQPIIGNFDGNTAGKEQLFTAVRGTAGNGENRYVIECFSVGGGDSRLLYSYTESDADALGRMVLTAPDADTDDGMVMRYTGKEYVFSNPEVMAVLQASPYFEDLLDDYENVGTTGFGTSSGTGSSFSNTVTNTVGAYVSFSQDFSVFGVKVASVEFQAAYNYEWSKTNETSHTYTTSINYEAGSGSNQVVMIATPVILYHYDVLDASGTPMATSEVSVSQEPCYSVLPVEDYNASAELLGNPVIDSNCVIGVVPGQPQTYPSSKWQIDSYGGVCVPFDTPVMAVQGNAVVSQEVSWEDSQSLTQSYSHNIEVSGGAGAAGFVIGASYGHSQGCDSTETVTSSVSRSGSVANIPAGNPDYSFKWQFATWDIQVGGYKVPVMGYIVTSVSQPPSVPQNLTATPGSDSVTLEWEPGYNAAVKYDIFRYYPEEKEDYQYDLIGTVDASQTSFVCEGLNPSTRYYFSIRAVGDQGLRSRYAEPVAVTTISPGQQLPKIQTQPVDRTVNVSSTRQTTFSTLATPTSGGTVSYAWECRDDSGSKWETITGGTDVSGYNTRTLTVYNITQSMDGTQYRCRVSERSGAEYPAVIYTRTATLTVGKSETTTTLTSPADLSCGFQGNTVKLKASVAASDNQACGGNVSFQITDTATGTVKTLMAEVVNGEAATDWQAIAGVYTIRASYTGDDTTEGSASETVTYYVQESEQTPCYEITLSGELVYGAHVTPSLKQWSNGQSAAVGGAEFQLYEYNGTEFESVNVDWDSHTMNPGEFRIDAILDGKVVAQKVFTVSKRPITITAPNIPSIVEGESLDLAAYNDQIIYSYDLEDAFKHLFTLSGVSAKEPLSGQYDISVVYANPDNPELSQFLNLFQPTFEKSVFTVKPSSEATKRMVTFAAGVNGSLKAYVSATSTQEITSSQRVSNGSTVFFSPEADEGFTVSKWTINGTEVTQEAIDAGTFNDCGNVRFSGDGLIVEGIQSDITVKVEFTNLRYTVQFSGSDGGSVTAIQGSTELSSPVEVCGGSNITFTAVPAEGKVVKSWQITRSNGTAETKRNPDDTNYTGTTLTLENINTNLTVQVEFEDAGDPFTVTYGVVDEQGNPTDGGLVTFSTEGLGENGTAQKGSTVKLTASAKPGTAILRWEVYDGNAWVTKEASADVYTIYSVQADTSVRVVIQPNSDQYTVTYSIENVNGDEPAGSLTAKTGERDVPSDSSCTAYSSVVFTYEESKDYVFVRWDVNGTKGTESSNGTTHTYTISALNANTQVKAVVRSKPTVSWTDPTGGTISVMGIVNGSETEISSGGYVDPNTTITVTATPNDGYVVNTINDIAVNTDKSNGSKTGTVDVLTENITVSVSFLAKPVVTFGCGSDGSVKAVLNDSDTEISSGGYADFGSSVTFTATPDDDYRVKGWYSDEAGAEPIPGTTSEQNSYTIESLGANTSVYVEFELITYTITFDTDGGTTIDPITLAPGAPVTTPENPTKTGYTFDGWDQEIPAFMPEKDVTITAKWTINQYTITFETNGGTPIEPITQDYGTDVTAPENPTKTGYTFDGWDHEVPGTMPAENMTITAQWKINQYTITFVTNGGTEIESITQDYGTAVTAPEDPTRAGYGFGGWYEDAELSIPFVFTEDTTITDRDITLYAKWNPLDGIKYTVNHNFEKLDGTFETEVEEMSGVTGTDTEAQAKTVTGFTAGSVTQQEIQGDGSTVIEITYTRNTYTLTFKPENGEEDIVTTVKYGDTITAPDLQKTGYTLVGWDQEIPDTMPAEDVTITAQWKINQYTITFDTDGGTMIAPITQDYGTTVTAPDAPTRTGYTFVGWDKEIPETMPAEDVTITAQWEANRYTITVEETEHGSVTADCEIAATDATVNLTVVPEEDYALATLTVTNENGYAFNADENEGNYSFTMPASNVSIKATFAHVVHHTTLTPAKEATCTETGNIAYYTCSGCDLWFKDEEATTVIEDHNSVIIPASHSYASTVTAPTCTEQGYTTHTCSICGDSYVDSYVDATGHSFGEWTETKEATCTDKGEESRSCAVCGETETRETAALGHNYQDGTCTNCGETEPTEPDPVPSIPVKPSWPSWMDKIFGDWWGDEEETCDHVYTSVVTEPTCEEKGYTTHTCEKCGDTYKDSYTDPLGHKWDEGTVTVEATCTEDGEKILACETCGKTKAEKIDALGHNFEDGVCTQCGAEEASEPENPGKPSWDNIWDWISGWWK